MGNANAVASGFDALTMNHSTICGTDPYNYETFDDDDLPRGLYFSFKFLTESQRQFCRKLCWMGQEHLFQGWTGASSPSPENKIRMVEQLQKLDDEYRQLRNHAGGDTGGGAGGLEAYLKTARKLLHRHRQQGGVIGNHPMLTHHWVPSIPTANVGHYFEFGSLEYEEAEALGIPELGHVGFVLVAGGGLSSSAEHLGYSNVKLSLPTEMTTETCYLQHYIEYILAYQEKYVTAKGCLLPLCIMTSAETNHRTTELLQQNDYFGMEKSQITIVQQGMGVPALLDTEARIALHPKDHAKILTRPHGHGDVHALLYSSGVVKAWKERQQQQQQHAIKWVCMFQDTNALAFHTLPLMLGVSVQHNLMMNSLAVPRKAKQAIGAIVQLTNSKTGEVRTAMNVEYNQLDALLRQNANSNNHGRGGCIFPHGDENDPRTGYSPFPGNVNQLLFRLDDYYNGLEKTKGIMPELIINPKYKDNNSSKTIFKRPIGLECLMQDFPCVLKNTNANTTNAANSYATTPKKSNSTSPSNSPQQEHDQQQDQDQNQEKDTQRVGFTCVAADFCFSPVKNSTTIGKALQYDGIHAGTAVTGEADLYASYARILSCIGCQISRERAETTETKVEQYLGIHILNPGPSIVLKPNFCCTLKEYKNKFPHPENVHISARSTLVVRGAGVVIESLKLDGCLIVDCDDGLTLTIRNREVTNEGWIRVRDEDSDNQLVRMRGYRLAHLEQELVEPEQSSCVIL
jgi:UDP-sugar pyrophosphorylase